MTYVVIARWTAKEGQEDVVESAFADLAPASRGEPGCRYYQPCRDLENPRVFWIYEIYDDEAAFKAHGASDHFRDYALGKAIPVLESRERFFAEPLD